jgi:hypothetical protein
MTPTQIRELVEQMIERERQRELIAQKAKI